MGGVAPRAPCWYKTYQITIDGWHQKIDAAVDPSQRRLIVVSEFYRLRDDLPSNHPFRALLGAKTFFLDSVDLGHALAEIDRVLKQTRRWIFWKEYRPTIRVIFSGSKTQRRQFGLVIADPSEQKKLMTFFRDAFAVMEGLD